MPTTSQKQTAKATEAARVAGTLFAPGASGNPGGKPVGSRNKLQGDFVRALASDFEQHGPEAIVAVRTDDPATYLRVIASLMPKEIDVANKFASLSDDELAAGIAALQALIAAHGEGVGLTIEATKVIDVQALQ